jgi:phosphoesterase RecJ-like protein
LNHLLELIHQSDNIVLSTHKQCDGDGLGAQLAMYHALKSNTKKNVHVINLDHTPRKYKFLNPDQHIQYFESNPQLPKKIDLVLIFDTNDERLLYPMFHDFKKATDQVAFVDHHPALTIGPSPTKLSWIDTSCASTGEMAYQLIKALKYKFNAAIAECIYTSITFDTQLYRFIRNSPNSHLIAAEMLSHKVPVQEIHRHLFGQQTVAKMNFLAEALHGIEYFQNGRIAMVRLKLKDILRYGLEPEDSRDVIDMIMNIENLEAAALFREDIDSEFKMSLRSKGRVGVLQIAESMGGGGHMFASGAYVKGPYEEIKNSVLNGLIKMLNHG